MVGGKYLISKRLVNGTVAAQFRALGMRMGEGVTIRTDINAASKEKEFDL